MTQHITQELLPCPFCGSNLVSKSQGVTGDGKPWFYIECKECAASAEPEMWNRRAALAQPASAPAQAVPEASKKGCWCTTCRPITFTDSRFVVCPECGNKRCPKAHNHALACTNSNETGQPGSSWESYPPAAPSTGEQT